MQSSLVTCHLRPFKCKYSPQHHILKHHQPLGSCDRASCAKYEERKTNKIQQLDVYY